MAENQSSTTGEALKSIASVWQKSGSIDWDAAGDLCLSLAIALLATHVYKFAYTWKKNLKAKDDE